MILIKVAEVATSRTCALLLTGMGVFLAGADSKEHPMCNIITERALMRARS